MNAALDKMVEHVPEMRPVARAFRFMAIAEEEMRDAMRRYPLQQRVVWNCFMVLMPGRLIDYGEQLYRAHCQELLDRAVDDQDLRPGTRAEVLAAISTATLRSRLTSDVEHLALNLASELWPSKATVFRAPREEAGGSGSRATWLRDFQRKTAVPTRVLRELRDIPGACATTDPQ